MDAIRVVACGFAAVSGWLLAVVISQVLAADARHRQMRAMVRDGDGDASGPEVSESPLIRAICRQSQALPAPWLHAFASMRFWGAGLADVRSMIAQAGLAGRATPEGVKVARVQAAIAGGAMGAVAGSLFSAELAGILGVTGFVGGYCRVPLALRSRAAARNADMERHLSEMLEVVVLGLQSGLSFERAFQLYPRYFESELGQSMARVANRWDMGLVSREQALRTLEEEYESPLLSRAVGSMVRSLRFGTSIAEALESSAVEARAAHRARMEERVAKVAVKMMLPVGTLILPAMLLLVLGPVMLELVQGF